MYYLSKLLMNLTTQKVNEFSYAYASITQIGKFRPAFAPVESQVNDDSQFIISALIFELNCVAIINKPFLFFYMQLKFRFKINPSEDREFSLELCSGTTVGDDSTYHRLMC